jgi:predicted NBD/HSP70 family sugar kinase
MSVGRPALPADNTAVRQANLALVLHEVRDRPRARARIAADIGMTKGTVSSLVTDLEARGLVVVGDGTPEGAVGRPGQSVQLVPSRVLGLGFSIGVHYLAGAIVDLAGVPVQEFRVTADAARSPVDAIVSKLVKLVARACDHELLTDGDSLAAGVAIAVPGLVDSRTGLVRKAPILGWHDVPLQDVMTAALRDRGLAVHVNDDGNLAALAENRQGSMAGTANMIYISGGESLRGGILVDGRILRGSSGFAGQVGHMKLTARDTGLEGRLGSWESLCGLSAFLAAASPEGDEVRNSSLDLDARLDLVLQRARAGDKRTLRAFQTVSRHLGLGLANLINLFNPSAIVLGGYFARVGEFLLEGAKATAEKYVLAEDLGGCAIVLSSLGPSGGAIGAAQFVLEDVFANPALVPLTTRAAAPRRGPVRIARVGVQNSAADVDLVL